MELAVNGTLMRGLELNTNPAEAGAVFPGIAKTRAVYRLFSINDIHPAMYRVSDGGAGPSARQNPVSGETQSLGGV